MIDTAKFDAESVTPETPASAADDAVACNVVQAFVGAAWSVATASANSTPDSASPERFATSAPFVPANADKPVAPTVNRSTDFVEPSSSFTEPVDFRSANEPLAVKKPLTSSASVPLASSSGPDWPDTDSERVVPVPVPTDSGCAAKSISVPSRSGRLAVTATFEPLSVSPSIPWNPAVAAVPSSAVQTRVGSLDSDAIANAKSTPPRPKPR